MTHVVGDEDPKLDERELQGRRAFYEITDEDLTRLANLRPEAEKWTGQIVEDFYDLLRDHPETRAVVRDEDLVQRLKSLQRDDFLGLFAGKCDLEYVEDHRRVGAAHERLGLAPRWSIGAYRRCLQLVHDQLYLHLPADQAGAAFASVLKLASFDVSLAVDAYVAARLETLGRHETGPADDARLWLATTLRCISDAVMATDAEGNVVMMNPIAERLTGYSMKEAAGHPLAEVFVVVNEETGEKVTDPIEYLLRGRAVLGMANRTLLVARSGVRTPIAESGTPIHDADGHARGVLLVFRDVTEEMLELDRQQFLAKAAATMASSLDYEETLARVANLAIPALADWCEIHVVDRESGLLKQVALAHSDEEKLRVAYELRAQFPSRAADRVVLLGCTELCAEVTDERLVAWATSSEHLSLLRALCLRSLIIVPLSSGASVFGAVTLAFAESDRRYDERDVPFFEEIGRCAAMVIDNARLYDSEQRARRAADEANRSKDVFLATVSHELRTPLSAILGWSRMLIRHPMDSATQARALGSIERSAVSMAKLIEDLLDFSRIVSGKMRIEPRLVDLAEVVSTALESVGLAADAKGIRLVSSVERSKRPYIGDPARLQQIVWNLVSNAVKFTAQGGTVEVALRPADDSMEIVVSDTGAGIEASFLPRLFDPFRQGGIATSRTTMRGLGLGLAITKHLVELHGGTIRAASPGLGKGSSFVVKLPNSHLRDEAREALLQSAPSSAAPTPRAAEPIPRLDGLRVLVVEDDADTRDLLREVLEQCGAEVSDAANTEEAMATFARAPPDVLLSDIGMQGDNGYDLIRRVRALPTAEGGAVAAAALTAYTRPEDRKTALDAGYTMHVSKPIDPGELARVVKRLASAAA